MTIKILLADDHPIVRSGIRNELIRHADLEVVGEAENGDEVLQLTEILQPNVLLLDINMPGPKTTQVVRTLQARAVSPRILILTAYGDLENVLGMLNAGVSGYLLKDEDPATITEGVRSVAQGRTWLSNEVMKSLAQRTNDKNIFRQNDLSGRELEVLWLVAQGCTNQQIAEGLGIAEGTVKNHITRIYDKLEVHSRAEAVAWVWQNNPPPAKSSPIL